MVTIEDGCPCCIKYMSNNHQHSKSTRELVYHVMDKIGVEGDEKVRTYALACGIYDSFQRPENIEKVDENYNCRAFAVKAYGLDMDKKGCDLCLSCPVCCGDRKVAANAEERQFISYLFRADEGRARKFLDSADPQTFELFVPLGNETNTFLYPMSVPLASMFIGIAKNHIEYFTKVRDLLSGANKTDDSGSVVYKNVSIPIVDGYVDAMIGMVADYCEDEAVGAFLSQTANRKVLWKTLCKEFISLRPMSDEEADEFFATHSSDREEEPVYTVPGDEFVVSQEEPSLFDGFEESAFEGYAEQYAERDAEAEMYAGYEEPAAVSEPSEEAEEEETEEETDGDNTETEEEPKDGMSVSEAAYNKLLKEKEQLEKKNEELARLSKESQYKASHDILTGLLNRTAYSDELRNEHSCVVFFDINNLKYVNDISGDHEKGDRLIKAVAMSIADRFGKELTFRTGGDEFVVFADGLDAESIKAGISDIKDELKSFTETGTEGIIYSVSAGYAFLQNGESLTETIQRADEHMKKDKKAYKKAHPELDARNIKPSKDKEESENENNTSVYKPEGELEAHPYFTRKVETTEGGYLTVNDKVRRVPMRNRRYIIPFAENDYSMSPNRNVIVHHEIEGAHLAAYTEEGVRRRVFEVKSNSEDREIESELDHLKANAKNAKMVACEVAYVTDQERYVLLMWNKSNNRIDYFELVNKADGCMNAMPRQIIDILKNEGIKKVCYQPYLLCAMMGLYIREVEIKNVHSIFSEYHVFNSQLKGVEWAYDSIMRSYTTLPSDKLRKNLEYINKVFGDCPMFMGMMMIYSDIATMQLRYSKEFGYDALCASRHRKDLMYGYSYLAAGIFPSMQKALFKLTPSGQFVFFNKPEPSISYFEGYMVQYMFRNINSDPGEQGEVREANEKSNVRARQLLLKDLATVGQGFYHTNLKILYFDEYYIVFYMAHNYLVQNQQFIETALKRECTKHKIVTDQFLYSCWATTFDMVRLVNKH